MVKGSIAAVGRELKKANSVLIFSHENPDGDAVGSAVAAGLILKSCGKTVDYAMDPKAKGFDEILPEMHCFSGEFSDSYDAALLVDCSTLAYVAQNTELRRAQKLIVIDHHKSNEGSGDACYIYPGAAAVGELIYELAGQWDVKISPEIARALYVSIHQDSGSFQYPNTTARTHEIAAALYKVCDDLSEVCEKLHLYDRQHLTLIQMALSRLDFYADGKLAIIELTRQNGFDGFDESNTQNIVNYMRYTKGCVLSVLIRQSDEALYKVSMRSSTDSLDLSAISKEYGGGGHAKAAGFLFAGDLDELRNYFIALGNRL